MIGESHTYLEEEDCSFLTKARIYLGQMETKPTMSYHQYAAYM
jgi:hypothetical protein